MDVDTIAAIFAADVDGDADVDVVAAHRGVGGPVSWYENLADENLAGSGFASTSWASDSALGGSAVYAVDVDGDDDVDFAAAEGGSVFWLDNANGTADYVSRETVGAAAANVTSLAAVDVDGDGDVDVVVGDALGNVAWFENFPYDATENNATVVRYAFTQHALASGGAEPWPAVVAPADVDGDGDVDVVVGGAAGVRWWAWENEWTLGGNVTDAAYVVDVAAADADGDADVDIVAASSSLSRIAAADAHARPNCTVADPGHVPAGAPASSCPGWDMIEGFVATRSSGSSCYALPVSGVGFRLTWQDARAQCQASGMDLVTIEGDEENYEIHGWVVGPATGLEWDEWYWTGLNELGKANAWAWANHRGRAYAAVIAFSAMAGFFYLAFWLLFLEWPNIVRQNGLAGYGMEYLRPVIRPQDLGGEVGQIAFFFLAIVPFLGVACGCLPFWISPILRGATPSSSDNYNTGGGRRRRSTAAATRRAATLTSFWVKEAMAAWEAERAARGAAGEARVLACTLCQSDRAAALNVPCNHLFLCEVVLPARSRGAEEPPPAAPGAVWATEDDGEAMFAQLKRASEHGSSLGLTSMRRLKEDVTTGRDSDAAAYLRRTCAACGDAKHLVVDAPCGHRSLCRPCAEEFREFNGEVCSRCREPSALCDPARSLVCSVCCDQIGAADLVTLDTCGHTICVGCSADFVRSALGDVAGQVVAAGLSCPLRPTGCSGVVHLSTVRRLVTLDTTRNAEVLPITEEEFSRVERFIAEASIPETQRFYCTYKDCAKVFAVDRDDVPLDGVVRSLRLKMKKSAWPSAKAVNRLRASRPTTTRGAADAEPAPFFVTCVYCQRQSCFYCKIPAHRALTCAEARAIGEGDESTTTGLIAATCKNCPKCGFGVTHFHGHACHHIMPVTGCPNCGHHFCYRCLRPGHSGSACGCRLFCQNDGVAGFVAWEPYPHDTRCGCRFCPDCAPGAPCPQCDGGCVVCRSKVPRPPRSLAGVATWWPEGKPKVAPVVPIG
ncbi:hypothetical protein JL722_8145 [Aureococcus anophagefferens]|nr:hypothetical protein JL722_8145 [Aureococcus anophagefferens]